MASLVFINAIRSSPAVICRHRHPSLHAGDNHAGYGPPLHAEPYACHACVLGPMAIRRGHLEATGTTPPRAQLETTDCVKLLVFTALLRFFSRVVNVVPAAPFRFRETARCIQRLAADIPFYKFVHLATFVLTRIAHTRIVPLT
ncbi:uncharacterized protein LOC142817702 isoform X1 [Rhipicephalus microplus]|uniref:uncharacterized protein LOC142793132 isoform X1 n=1 Tax=Rhipicephalus microplus TaxID=6941 RepID=UPI003F6C8AFF